VRVSLGQVGYEAYFAAAGGKTFDGRDMPSWDYLGTSKGGLETQRRWEIAALAIAGHAEAES
jgi:hypothetical protein